ncbi:MAG: hypothetical protein A9183_00685 [Dehalococcoides mccartyi]|uniref:DUF1848 domain-containing protein n=1 Tax=Dehalococcoides mccartyi TaxID=61435 RepID=UPI000804E2F6|nr:DUF1848 domain-containing protein [Dehalococcoides mccartyi]OBW62925.1 MAG: hypothetical protein A9183_00685 [Dehalococcoides mccartyi]
MIISASRRTDIPAFYSTWLMNRIRAGWCSVPNPLNTKQVSRVSLLTQDVEALVLWSKNPAPLLPHLNELDERKLRYYFQFTLNDYPKALEPNIPSLERRINTFIELSKHVGSLRVIWRYDPILFSNFTPLEYHVEKFSSIAQELKGSTKRVMVSIVDLYKKTERRLYQLEKEESYSFNKDVSNCKDIRLLLKELSTIAKNNDIEIFTCAEEDNYSDVGVPPGRCIDDGLLNRLWPTRSKHKKDSYQREYCLCVESKDIGVNNTCLHGCPYCYATINSEVAQRRFNEHDPLSPTLWPKTDESETKNSTKDSNQLEFQL